MNRYALEMGEVLPGKLNVRDGHPTRAQRVRIGPWDTIQVNHGINIESQEESELLERLAEWEQHFPRTHRNLALELFGVHSLLVRVDYIYTPNVGTRIFEVEERPAGIGMMLFTNKKFRAGLRQGVDSWAERLQRPLGICISEGRRGSSDDELWAEALLDREHVKVHHGLPDERTAGEHAWWVRCNRDEAGYGALTPHSLSTVELEGDKSYGVPMGLWHPIRRLSDIPFETGCVLKPAAGSRFERIEIVCEQRKHQPGYIGTARAIKRIKAAEFIYWQPLYQAESHAQHKWLKPDYHLMRRAFFVFMAKPKAQCNGHAGSFVSIGGCWMATPDCRGHGTPETLTGPLYASTQLN